MTRTTRAAFVSLLTVLPATALAHGGHGLEGAHGHGEGLALVAALVVGGVYAWAKARRGS